MKKVFLVSLSVMIAMMLVFSSITPVSAASVIYVRADGDDTNCNGTANAAYPGSGGPNLNCAVKTIQKGIDLVEPGGTVIVSNGTYTSSTINVEKSVTVEGSGSTTILNAGVSGGYGLYVTSGGFTLKKVKVSAVSGTLYAVKISGIDNIAIEDVEITGATRSGLDLIGCSNASLKDIFSHDNGGVGVAISNSENVTLTNITTSNNAWGGVGLFTNKTYYTNNLNDGKTGLDGIELTGTNSFGELNPLYLDYDDPSHVIRNFVQSDFDYVVLSTNSLMSRFVYYQESKNSSLDLINAIDLAATPPGSYKPTAAIQSLADGSFHVLSDVMGSMKITPAVQLAEENDQIFIDHGVFTDTVNLNKPVQLIGVGSGDVPNNNTILRKSTNAAVISITASGTEDNPIVIKDIRIEPQGVYGINIPSGTVEHVRLENVKVIGTKPSNDTESEVGLKVATSATLRYVTIEDSSFDKLHYGWYFAKHGDWTAGGSTVEELTVLNSTFNENSSKGIYVEKLSQATFTNITVDGNGWNTTFWNAQWNAGIDINLKGESVGKSYQNIIFNNPVVKNNALGTKNGAGLMIKARDDGSTYSLYPASLNNVQIIGGVFEGNERGIRFGEPDKNNQGPTNVLIQNATIRNNLKTYAGTDGSAYGAVINYTQQEIKAEKNYWGTLSWVGYGSVHGIQNVIYGDIDWQPWANDTFTEDYDIPTVTYADDDNAGKSEGDAGANGGIFGYNAFVTIKDALAHVANGGTIYVGAGTYEEQVVIDKDVNIFGAGVDSTVIKSPGSLSEYFTTSYQNKPIVFVKEDAEVALKDFTVDGDGRGNTNYRFLGIGFYNAGGVVERIKVINIQDTPFSGLQHGLGVYAYNSDGNPRSIIVRNTTVSEFQKNGITVVGAGLTATIENNVVQGIGETATIAQNGIQTTAVSAASIENNQVQNIAYNGGYWTATGILVFGPSDNVTISNNTVESSQTAIYIVEANTHITRNTIRGPECVGDGCYGILVGDPLGAMPNPLDDNYTPFAFASNSKGVLSLQAENPNFEVSLVENEIEGSFYENKESIGLGVYVAYYGDNSLSFSAVGNIVGGWNNGVVIDECAGSGDCTGGSLSFLEVSENAIEGNNVGLSLYNITDDLNFEMNWWDSKYGPKASGNPKGNGQLVNGDKADYIPWLCDGTDTQPEVLGFQPAEDADSCTNLFTKLVFTQYPDIAYVNIPFAQQPIVRAEDNDGNWAITFDGYIFIDIANNPTGGVLLPGPLYKKALDGEVTFSNLYINKIGQGYQLKAFGLGTEGDFIIVEGEAFDVLKQQADLSIAVTDDPDPVNVGADLTYTIAVTNNGPNTAQGISVIVQLPSGFVLQSGGGAGWTCSQIGNVVTCTRASLPGGQTVTINIQGTAPSQAGSISTTATVTLSDDMDDPDSENNTATITTTVVELPPTGPSYILYLPLVLNNPAP